MTDPQDQGGRLSLLLLLLLNAVIASSELWSAGQPRNDALLHIHQVERMELAYQNGESLLDHWDPTIGLGYPFTRTYSCGTHLLLWALGRVSGQDLNFLYRLLTFLAWTLWPLAVFRGFHWMGFSPRVALAAAWLAPLLHTSFRFGIATESYFWLGYGLLPNLLGLVLFPLALGLGIRFLLEGRSFFPFVLTLSLTLFTHLIMGYVTTLSLVIFLLAVTPAWRSRYRAVLARLCLSGFATLSLCLFFLFPYFTDGEIINRSRFEPKAYWDSYPVGQILESMLTGSLLDHHVLIPVISLLALLGLVLELRAKRFSQPLLVLLGFWFLIFLGRTQWNIAVWLLPLGRSLPLERCIIPVQFFSIGVAAHGLVFVLEWLSLKMKRSHVVWTFGFVCLLGPHLAKNVFQNWIQASHYKSDLTLGLEVAEARLKPVLALLANNRDGGRLLVPAVRSVTYGKIGYYQIPIAHDIPHVGNLWHSMSLNSDYLYLLDPEKLDQWQLFGLKYGLAPPGYWKNGSLQSMNRAEDYEITRNPSFNGLFDFGQISAYLEGAPSDHFEEVVAWLRSSAPGQGLYLGFSMGKKSGTIAPLISEVGTFKQGLAIKGPSPAANGIFGYELETRSTLPGYLIARVTWHPQWLAQVDGKAVETVMVSPALTAIPLPPGTHHISLHYKPSSLQSRLLILSALAFLLCAIHQCSTSSSLLALRSRLKR